MEPKQIVIVGAGFGGVAVAESLASLPNCQITMIDRRNFHLFQPLLYQVAMAGLNPSDITVPLRSLFRDQKNIQVIMGDVNRLDFTGQTVTFGETSRPFDYLVLACGSKHGYFGNEHWEEFAPGLKSLEQAIEIRSRILTAFELAEIETDPEIQKQLLTFVVVGGGPTGVEIAGAIAEITANTLVKDFQTADLNQVSVILVEGGSRVLSAFPRTLSAVAQKDLESLGVEVRTQVFASELSKEGLRLGDEYVKARTIIWAAGVSPSELNDQVPGPKDSAGRISVTPDLSLLNHKNIFVIGDQAIVIDEKGFSLPGVAPVAVQEGHFVGQTIRADFSGKARGEFKYFDKGIMATIGRSKAVVSTMGFNFSGFFAWLTWVFVHVVYLMRFRNRVFVMMQWSWSYFTFGHGARLITNKDWRFYRPDQKEKN
ncbi:MAG: NAD(P)/FAD-dependent oxidoreductase [Moraxellaceae bacterium]|nr:NAD(P)/FAD-dependent oxidoreductase [Pseudobdellovibrionaceae bacterium]